MAKTEFSNSVICDICKKPGRPDDIVRSFRVLTSSGEYETDVRACLDCVESEYKGLHFKRFISYIMSLMLVPGFPLVVNRIRVGGRPSLLDIACMILFAIGFCGIILALVFHNPRKKALDYAIRKGLEHKIPPMATCVKPIREEAPPVLPSARDGESFMVKFPSLKIMFGSRLTRLYAIRTLRALGKPKSAKSLVGAMMVQARYGPDHLLADEVLLQEIEEAVVELGQVSVKPLIFHLKRQNLKENERKAAVEILSKIGGKEVLDALKKAAINDKGQGYGRLAVEKLEDQKVIADIAKNAGDKSIRTAAVEKLEPEKHQGLLIDIAKNDREWVVCKAAVKKLGDQEVLADIAKNAGEKSIRTAAVEKLEPEKHQELLIDIAKNDKERVVRKAAVEKLGDQEIIPLKEIAYVLVVRNGPRPPDDTLYVHRVLERTAPEALSTQGVKIKGYFEAGSVDQTLALSLAVQEWGLDPLDRDKYDLLTQDFKDDEGGGGMVLKCIPKKR